MVKGLLFVPLLGPGGEVSETGNQPSLCKQRVPLSWEDGQVVCVVSDRAERVNTSQADNKPHHTHALTHTNNAVEPELCTVCSEAGLYRYLTDEL